MRARSTTCPLLIRKKAERMAPHFRSVVTRRAIVKSCAALPVLALASQSMATRATSDGKLLISRSDYQFPFGKYEDWLAFMDRAPNPAWRGDRMRELVGEAAFERYRNNARLISERFEYRSDRLAIKGLAFRPRTVSAPLPVILFAHGGVGQWGRITTFDVLEMQRLAERGYCVLASTFRGEGGSEGEPNLGAGDRADMLNLLRVAPEIARIDPDRIGLWGFSRGGGLGYRTLAATDAIRAAVLIGATSDLVNSPRREEFDEHVYPGIVDGYEADPDAALRALSAGYWPEDISASTSILLVHGAKDNRVTVDNTLKMAQHFARLDRSFEAMVLENGSHTLIEHWERVRTTIDRWFDLHLRTGQG